MIEEVAMVTACEEGYAQVETERHSACSGCAAKSDCGTAALSGLIGKRRTAIRARNTIGAKPGDQVVIGLRESVITKASLASYGVPLLSLGLFALLGEQVAYRVNIPPTETFSIMGGLLGLVIGLLWLRRFSAKIATDEHYQAMILRPAEKKGMLKHTAKKEAVMNRS